MKLGEDAIEKTRQTLELALTSGQIDFSALFVISYETALAALKLLDCSNIKIPQDLSLIAFGQLELPDSDRLRPSSIGHSVDKIAGAAVDILMAQLSGDFQSPSQIEIDPEFFDYGTLRDISGVSESSRSLQPRHDNLSQPSRGVAS